MGLLFTIGGLYLFGWTLLVVQVFLLVDFVGMLMLDFLKASKFRQHAADTRANYSLAPILILSILGTVSISVYSYIQTGHPFSNFNEFWSALNKDMGSEMLLFPLFLVLPYMEFKMDFLMFSRYRKMEGRAWNSKRLLFAGISYASLLAFSFLSPEHYAKGVLIFVALIKFGMDVLGIQWEEKQRT